MKRTIILTGFTFLAGIQFITAGAATPPVHFDSRKVIAETDHLCWANDGSCATISHKSENDIAEDRLDLFDRSRGSLRSEVLAREADGERAWLLNGMIDAKSGRPIFPVIADHAVSYAGGGGYWDQLILFRYDPKAGSLREILRVPWSSSVQIRACFTKQDRRTRLGACQDLYEYASTLSAVPSGSGPPVLIYKSQARTFPGVRSRSQETKGPRHKADLKWASDRGCSMARIFRWSASAKRYLPDRPLAACENYFGF